MIEVYKCLKSISPPFTWDYFKQKDNPCNLKNKQLIELSKCKTNTYGLNTTLSKRALLQNKLPNHFKEVESLVHFENKIREWTGMSCTYCICS